MNFTVDWFSDHVPTWERLVLPRLKGVENPRYLEIGVHEGRSLIWMLDNVPNLQATAVDPLNLNGQYDVFKENVGNRAQLFQNTSRDFLVSDFVELYDVVYVDGSHWAKDVLSDTVLIWPNVNPKGILIWDDYGWLVDDDPIKGPKSAIDAFLTCYRGEYKVLHIGYQFIVEKV